MILRYFRAFRVKRYYRDKNLRKLDTQVLLSLFRHDCHRIEKAYYNGNIESKLPFYQKKLTLIKKVHSILSVKEDISQKHPVILWGEAIMNRFPDIEGFVMENKNDSYCAKSVFPEKFADAINNRRSCRTWSSEQPSESELEDLAKKCILVAMNAPNSGNRQSWRFAVITDKKKKNLLKGLKEKHCYTAPLLIYVGLDSRFYKPSSHLESCQAYDAGAAIMQIINMASLYGYGTCWNYLGNDLINSRPQNKQAYQKFSRELGIPEYVHPSAIIAIGCPEYLPPKPERLNLTDVMI